MRSVARGDQQAFLELYDRHAARVFGLARRMLGQAAAAEEVSQETFLKLWTRAGSFNPRKGSLLTWLLTIARRSALDCIRLQRRRPRLDRSQVALSALPDPASDTSESRWRSLHFALQDLPSDQRQTIELAYYFGLSQSQIADQLGLPLGTVKTRMRLGMQKLREALLEPQPPSGAEIQSEPDLRT